MAKNSDFNLIVLETDGQSAQFEVLGKTYTIDNDTGGISISASGEVTGLDPDAYLQISKGPVTVNGTAYTAKEIKKANNSAEYIIGYEKKNGELSSYMTDANHPLISPNMNVSSVKNVLGLSYGMDQMFFESFDDNLNRSADTIPAQVYLNSDAISNTTFNNKGKNLAVVTDSASGMKNITLGKKGDAVIMDGSDEYGLINIVSGKGNDTVVVRGNTSVNFDMSKGGKDKIITYATANANITLDNYDETNNAGVVLHEPEIPYTENIISAIEDGLLVFEKGQIFSIDRGEIASGTDRKTSIKVNNKNSAHQSMIRLFGYKDNRGQLVGFTEESGGILNASDLEEALVLVGNRKKDSIIGGSGNDYLVGNAGNDYLDGGKGNDTLTGGKGNDIFVYTAGKDVITDYSTGDKISLGAAISKSMVSGKDVVFTIGKGTLTIEKAKGKTLSLIDSAGKEYSTVVGGKTLILTNDKESSVKVDSSIKVIDASKRKTAVEITGNSKANTISGGNKNDTIYGESGNDSIVGNAGNDKIYGGKGNDILIGGKGNDSLWGDAGADTFIYSSGDGKDIIYGFDDKDTLTLDSLDFKTSYKNDALTIKFDSKNIITLKDFTATTFHINNETYQISGKKLVATN